MNSFSFDAASTLIGGGSMDDYRRYQPPQAAQRYGTLTQGSNGQLYVLSHNNTPSTLRRGPMLNGLPFAPPPPPVEESDGESKQ